MATTTYSEIQSRRKQAYKMLEDGVTRSEAYEKVSSDVSRTAVRLLRKAIWHYIPTAERQKGKTVHYILACTFTVSLVLAAIYIVNMNKTSSPVSLLIYGFYLFAHLFMLVKLLRWDGSIYRGIAINEGIKGILIITEIQTLGIGGYIAIVCLVVNIILSVICFKRFFPDYSIIGRQPGAVDKNDDEVLDA